LINILIIIFSCCLGAPGTGKSVQCKKICEVFGFAHISKDVLIREVEAGTERGLKIAEMLKNKEDVPDVRITFFNKRKIILGSIFFSHSFKKSYS